MAVRGPAMHHRVGHIGMELEAEGLAILERLVWKVAALREQIRADGKLKTLAMPMINMVRPVPAERYSSPGRPDRVIAHLRAAFWMRRHAGPEMERKHLRAEADAKKRPLLPERDGDPLDLAADVVVRVVRAHRAAEDDGSCMLIERLRQRVAEARLADIEGMAKCAQHIADTAGR